MASTVRVGIIGDFESSRRSHVATNESLRHAADQLAVQVETVWLPTPSLLGRHGLNALEAVDGLWAAPGSPYRSMDGALSAIRFARERDWPFVGT
ncbi:MAG: hypothetical protein HY726_08475 [Candidatus Rokubacteria bacterium]|nr:hypothetical protein [Candidatus Rokubacteria bacterium]